MIRKYAEKMWVATHIFSAKNIRILFIESAKTVNEMTLNELIKLTTLWTTGLRFSRKKLDFRGTVRKISILSGWKKKTSYRAMYILYKCVCFCCLSFCLYFAVVVFFWFIFICLKNNIVPLWDLLVRYPNECQIIFLWTNMKTVF